MPICMTARYRVRPHFTEACKNTVQDLVEHVKAKEPGTLFYLAKQEILNPRAFQHLILFENEAALAIHQSSKASERFVNALYPETVEPVEFMEYNIIAFKGGNP